MSVYSMMPTHENWLVSSRIELSRSYNATGRVQEAITSLEIFVKMQKEVETSTTSSICSLRLELLTSPTHEAKTPVKERVA